MKGAIIITTLLPSTEPGFSSASLASNSLPTRSRFNGNSQCACTGVEHEELFPGQLTSKLTNQIA